MIINDTRTFLDHYAHAQQARLRPRRLIGGRADRAGLRVHLGRALISLGASMSGERVERAARRSSPARPA